MKQLRFLKRNFSKLNKNSFDFLKNINIKGLESNKEFKEHYPVMYKEVESQIEIFYEENKRKKNKFKMLECGIGTGGHAFRILEKYPFIDYYGVDLDPEMIKKVQKKSKKLGFENRIFLKNLSYTELDQFETKGFQGRRRSRNRKPKFDIILADFGYNQAQIESLPGLSYIGQNSSDLDMRYDQNPTEKKIDAKYVLNEFSEHQLTEIFFLYGEIKSAKYLSEFISKKRKKKLIESNQDLRDILVEFANLKGLNSKKILKTGFQALRIFVNDELINVHNLAKNFHDYLYSGGMGMFITFHSLEERILKAGFMDLRKDENIMKSGRVLVDGRLPSKEEVGENSASRSAKFFCFKLDDKLRFKGKKDVYLYDEAITKRDNI